MEKFKIFAVLFISTVISIQAVQLDFDQVVLGGTAQEETINFSISNKGTSTVYLKFIVIQDHVLMLTQGEVTLTPNDVHHIKLPKTASGVKEYKLQVTQKIGSAKANQSVKEYIIKG